jgi:hypothetical protein
MTDNSQWERAEAAFGHVQQAASEMIAAAHDALDLLDGVVSTADPGAVFHTFNDLSRSLFNRGRGRGEGGGRGGGRDSPGPNPERQATTDQEPPARPHSPVRSDSPVQRISVR